MKLNNALELRKAKYIKRWKGKDGKWEYEYPRDKKDRKKELSNNLEIKLRQKENEISKLGYEKCYVFDKNGKQIFEKSGEKNLIRFAPEEINKIKQSKVFIHNHPSGGSFSPDDIKFAYFLDVKEMRIASKKYNYSIKLRNVGRQTTPWEVFAKIIDDSDKLTQRLNEKKISTGKLSVKQAEENHWHQVCESVTKGIDGIEYQKIKRKKQ